MRTAIPLIDSAMEVVFGPLSGRKVPLTEADRIVRETDITAARERLQRLSQEVPQLEAVAERSPAQGRRWYQLYCQADGHVQGLVQLAVNRVADLETRAAQEARAKAEAERVQTDPIFGAVARAQAEHAQKAEARYADLDRWINGQRKTAEGNPVPPPQGDDLMLAVEERRLAVVERIKTKTALHEALRKLREHEAAGRAATCAQLMAEYQRRLLRLRNKVAAALEAVDEVRALALKVRIAGGDVPFPEGYMAGLPIWLERTGGGDAA